MIEDELLDKKAQIDKCLNCIHPVCINCLSPYRVKQGVTPWNKVSGEEIIRLYNKGAGAYEMSVKLQIKESTVKDWFRNYFCMPVGKEGRGVMSFDDLLRLPRKVANRVTYGGEPLLAREEYENGRAHHHLQR